MAQPYDRTNYFETSRRRRIPSVGPAMEADRMVNLESGQGPSILNFSVVRNEMENGRK